MDSASRKRLLIGGIGLAFLLTILSTPAYSLNTDHDQDGLTDAYETGIGADPYDADSDDDGMPDGWEDANGTNPLVNDDRSDPETDGLNNLGEYLMGCDPQANDSDLGGEDDGDELDIGRTGIG